MAAEKKIDTQKMNHMTSAQLVLSRLKSSNVQISDKDFFSILAT